MHNKESEFEFVRLVGTERRVADTLEGVSRSWQGKDERFLFISPHDDDAVLGGGLLIQLALRENIPVHVIIVTDGAMGYCTPEQKESISDIRRQETYESFRKLGVPAENIIWMGFPDCRLNECCGRKEAAQDDPLNIEGYVGLQNSFTKYIRQIAPSQCFLPTSTDLHPDHKIVHEEFLISLFHSAGNIWPELGTPIQNVPYVHEMAVYCDFPGPPNLRMKTPESYLEKKLEAISAFKSQQQIASLIEIVRRSGPFEYLSALNFKLYQPAAYYDMFEKKHSIPFIR